MTQKNKKELFETKRNTKEEEKNHKTLENGKFFEYNLFFFYFFNFKIQISSQYFINFVIKQHS